MFMDLYKEILINVLAKENLQIIFPNLKIYPTKIVELECYKALQKLRRSSKMIILPMKIVL